MCDVISFNKTKTKQIRQTVNSWQSQMVGVWIFVLLLFVLFCVYLKFFKNLEKEVNPHGFLLPSPVWASFIWRHKDVTLQLEAS